MTLIIDNMIFDLPFVDLIGQPANDFARVYLNNVRWNRLRVQMSWWLRQCEAPPTPADFQAELSRRNAAFIFDGEASEDELDAEALDLAEDHLRRLLSADGLPAPKNIREHAIQLVSNDDSFRARARRRIEARVEAATQMSNALQVAAP